MGKASGWYLSLPVVPQNILEYQPKARFIIRFRNPIETAVALHSEMPISGPKKSLTSELHGVSRASEFDQTKYRRTK
jgi:hypothetical protein